MTVITQNERLLTKMTVIFDQNDRCMAKMTVKFMTKMTVSLPSKWALYDQNDRCMTKMTDIFDQNDRYKPKWPLFITEMTIIAKHYQNDCY